MKKIAIIGRPNVGKSSLFNRLVKNRDAITSEQAGTTRDVKRRHFVVNNKEALLLDTGGLDKGCELFDKIKEMSLRAAYAADIILYMVDGKSIPEDEDKKFFYELQAMGKDMALVVNKIDNDKMKENLWDYYEFGTDAIFGISVAHNRNTVELLDWIADKIPEEDTIKEEEEVVEVIRESVSEVDDEEFFKNTRDEDDDGFTYWDDDEMDGVITDDSIFGDNDRIKEFDEEDVNHIKIAIIGRTNVGKSSLLNALLNFDRAIVSDIAGTTRDTIEEQVKIGTHLIRMVDTAGIREANDEIEKIGIERSLEAIEQSDIVVALFDSSRAADDEDKKIVKLLENARESKKVIVIKNKIDLEHKFSLSSLCFDLELNSKDDVSSLVKALENIMDRSNSSDEIMLISSRQINAVEETMKNIEESFVPLEDQELEIFSFHLNEAVKEMASITRPFENDEMLDKMFGSFCLGK